MTDHTAQAWTDRGRHCPLCNGSGLLEVERDERGLQIGAQEEFCQTCQGTGRAASAHPRGGDSVTRDFDHEAIHLWFELSYAPYLVIARSILQSMPDDWQKQFVLLLEELQREAWKCGIESIEPRYYVTARDDKGKFVPDPFRNYERGRRRVFT